MTNNFGELSSFLSVPGGDRIFGLMIVPYDLEFLEDLFGEPVIIGDQLFTCTKVAISITAYAYLTCVPYSYEKEINETFNFEWIDKHIFDYVTMEDDWSEPYGRVFINSQCHLFPSGKIYAFWTTNQTQEDVIRDELYDEALTKVLKDRQMWYECDSGDVFFCKATTCEDLGTSKGYEVHEADTGAYYWMCTTDSDNHSLQGPGFETEDEAWRDCLKVNGLVNS